MDGGAPASSRTPPTGRALPINSRATGSSPTRVMTARSSTYSPEHLSARGSSDTSGGAQSTGGLDISGSNLIVTDNTIDNAGMGIYADWGSADANDQINGNNIYNTNWAIASVRQTNGGTIGPTYIYANHLHDWANWDTTSDTFHHNGLHCTPAEASPPCPTTAACTSTTTASTGGRRGRDGQHVAGGRVTRERVRRFDLEHLFVQQRVRHQRQHPRRRLCVPDLLQRARLEQHTRVAEHRQ